MTYVGTEISDKLSVNRLFTVLKPILTSPQTRGESHDFPEIFYLASGTCTLSVDDITYSLKAGQMIVYAPGAHHRIVCHSVAAPYIISFASDSVALSDIYNRVINLNILQKDLITDIIDDAVVYFKGRSPGDNILGMVLKEGVPEYALQKIKKQLEFFLIDILKATTHTEYIAQRLDKDFHIVTEFLKKNIYRSLTLDEIANRCSMSVSKLKLLFRKKHGNGPINYFIELKIEEAKRLLRGGKMNCTEISAKLGFASLHYFSRLFKKLTGVSPTEYARNI